MCDERDVTNEIENACDGGRVPRCKTQNFRVWDKVPDGSRLPVFLEITDFP